MLLVILRFDRLLLVTIGWYLHVSKEIISDDVLSCRSIEILVNKQKIIQYNFHKFIYLYKMNVNGKDNSFQIYLS